MCQKGEKMIDIKLLRENPELVKENMKKKFQEEKIHLVDEVLDLDEKQRAAKTEGDNLRSERNKVSKEIGALMGQGKKDLAEEAKAHVGQINDKLTHIEEETKNLGQEVKARMQKIPQIIDESVPLGKDDSENVENDRYGDPIVPDYEVPYHVDIMESFDGIDLDAARETSGSGFYYLKGDIARLQSAILSYARDFMIDRGYTYYCLLYTSDAADE